jgi:uncharacterized repeat protein (TIGR04076 family)
MAIDERMWKLTQKHLGYTDKDMKAFRENPRNEDILAKGSALRNKTIILEVVESHGCNSRHKVGDRFYFDAVGNLLTARCPKKLCAYSLNSALMMVFAANEMIFAGVDPNEMRFKRSSCFDVGLQCGGWGRVVLELKVEEQ